MPRNWADTRAQRMLGLTSDFHLLKLMDWPIVWLFSPGHICKILSSDLYAFSASISPLILFFFKKHFCEVVLVITNNYKGYFYTYWPYCQHSAQYAASTTSLNLQRNLTRFGFIFLSLTHETRSWFQSTVVIFQSLCLMSCCHADSDLGQTSSSFIPLL